MPGRLVCLVCIILGVVSFAACPGASSRWTDFQSVVLDVDVATTGLPSQINLRFSRDEFGPGCIERGSLDISFGGFGLRQVIETLDRDETCGRPLFQGRAGRNQLHDELVGGFALEVTENEGARALYHVDNVAFGEESFVGRLTEDGEPLPKSAWGAALVENHELWITAPLVVARVFTLGEPTLTWESEGADVLLSGALQGGDSVEVWFEFRGPIEPLCDIDDEGSKPSCVVGHAWGRMLIATAGQ